MTINESIASVFNGTGRSTDDYPIRRRFVYRELKNARNELIKQELNKYRLLDDNSGQTIDCFKLKRSDASSCFDCPTGIFILSSDKQLPEIIQSENGIAIINIYMQNGIALRPMTFADFQNRKNRRNTLSGSYGYAIRNRKLHILGYEDIDELEVAISAHYTDPEIVERLINSGDDCDNKRRCKATGDLEFVCPGHLSRRVIEITRQAVLRSLGIPLDNSNNSKFDVNAPSQKSNNP